MKFSALTRIYTTSSIEKNQTINFTDDSLYHLKIALRMKIGEKFRIFNQTDGEYIAEINKITHNELSAKVGDLIRQVTHQRKLTLGMCIIKPDKVSQVLRSSTELGITEFIPIISDRTQFKEINLTKLNKIIVQATEQSERFDVPVINQIMSLDNLVTARNYQQIIFANEEEPVKLIKDIKHWHNEVLLLIGPEGGFTNEEKQQLTGINNVISVSLGKNVLRCETAALAGLACINMMRD